MKKFLNRPCKTRFCKACLFFAKTVRKKTQKSQTDKVFSRRALSPHKWGDSKAPEFAKGLKAAVFHNKIKRTAAAVF